jgi:malonyl-CoA O-methyltransferase
MPALNTARPEKTREKKNIAFLPGWGFKASIWDYIAAQFSNENVFLVELPSINFHTQANNGCHPSANKNRPPLANHHSHPQESRDALANTRNINTRCINTKHIHTKYIIETINRQLPNNCILIGWSLGGIIAADLCLSFPGKYIKLVTVATNPKFIASRDWIGINENEISSFYQEAQRDLPGLMQEFCRLVNGNNKNPAIKKILQANLNLNHLLNQAEPAHQVQYEVQLEPQHEPPHEPQQQSQHELAAKQDALLFYLNYLMQADKLQNYSQLQLPILHIFGDKDYLVPHNCAKAIKQKYPQHNVASITHAGHIPFLSHSIDFLKQLLGFIHRETDDKTPKKNHIQKAFNRAANTYDENAQAQHYIGKKLISVLTTHHTQAKTIIDLGCGSGKTTAELAAQYDYTHFHAIDIAPALLALAHQRLNPLNIQLSEMNFNGLLGIPTQDLPNFSDQFDLVYSNMALQWSENFLEVLKTIYSMLSTNGSLAFSIPLTGTFQELTPHCSINKFMSKENIIQQLTQAGYHIAFQETENVTLSFSNLIQALKYIKNLGANHVIHREHGNKGLHSKAYFKKAYSKNTDLKNTHFNKLTYVIGYFIVCKSRNVKP